MSAAPVLPVSVAPVTGMAQQWLLSYAFGRVYDASLGPMVRQGLEHALGRPHTPAYVPPTSVGFLARDLVLHAGGFVLGQQAFNLISRVRALGGSPHAARNLLTTSGGLAGAQAHVGAQMSLLALRNLAGRTFALSLLFTAGDALMANVIGPRVEGTVNRLLGKHPTSTSKTHADGTIPQSIQRVGPEQLVRNLAHNTIGSITYSATLATAGGDIARLATAAVPGAGGALLGALGAALVASAVCGTFDRLVSTHVADGAQSAVRAGERLLGRHPAPHRPDDVIPVPGDRLSGAVRGVLVPFATAATTGQQRAFVQSIAPT